MPQDEYSGTIPPIAEKEKNGRKINVHHTDMPYVLELTSNVELNIPPAN